MNYYEEIKKKLIDDNIYSIVKDYSKEKHNLITQYEIGKLLDEAMFQNLLSKLQKGTDRRTIVEMLFRYEEFTKDCNRYGVRPNR